MVVGGGVVVLVGVIGALLCARRGLNRIVCPALPPYPRLQVEVANPGGSYRLESSQQLKAE